MAVTFLIFFTFVISAPLYTVFVYVLSSALISLNHTHPTPITVCSPNRVSSTVSMGLPESLSIMFL